MFEDLIAKYSAMFGVPQDVIYGVIQTESSGNPNATSGSGAQGLMQLMPKTAQSLGVTDPYDPDQNIMGGTKYLAELLATYGGDLDKALSAYNQGPGNLNKYGITNQSYVDKVKSFMSQFTGGGSSETPDKDKDYIEYEKPSDLFNKNKQDWYVNVLVVLCIVIVILLGVFFFAKAFNIVNFINPLEKLKGGKE